MVLLSLQSRASPSRREEGSNDSIFIAIQRNSAANVGRLLQYSADPTSREAVPSRDGHAGRRRLHRRTAIEAAAAIRSANKSYVISSLAYITTACHRTPLAGSLEWSGLLILLGSLYGGFDDSNVNYSGRSRAMKGTSWYCVQSPMPFTYSERTPLQNC